MTCNNCHKEEARFLVNLDKEGDKRLDWYCGCCVATTDNYLIMIKLNQARVVLDSFFGFLDDKYHIEELNITKPLDTLTRAEQIGFIEDFIEYIYESGDTCHR